MTCHDIVGCAIAAGEIYNVVDDDPASRMEVVAYARGLLLEEKLPGKAASSSAEAQQPQEQVRLPSCAPQMLLSSAFPSDAQSGLPAWAWCRTC